MSVLNITVCTNRYLASALTNPKLALTNPKLESSRSQGRGSGIQRETQKPSAE